MPFESVEAAVENRSGINEILEIISLRALDKFRYSAHRFLVVKFAELTDLLVKVTKILN